MKKLKKLLLVLCVSLLTVTCVSVPSNAKEENTSKQEVIYINLNSDGSVDNIDVVNIFDLSKDQTIIDYGEYTSVSNMNTSDAITYENNKVSINASKGKVYYEGKLENKNIPWNFNIKYTMDGKSYSADEIAGKSGKLKIDISIKQNKSVDESFFKAYALQVTLTLDTNKASNIIASGATLANVGSDKQITYTILPDTEKDLTLTADVIDFEMDAIAINGVRMDLDVDLDSSELTDKVSDIKDAVNDLNDGAKKLYDGSNDLKNGLATLTSKNSELNNGAYSVFDKLCSTAQGQINTTLVANGMDTIELNPGNYTSVLNNLLSKFGVNEIYNQYLEVVTQNVEANADTLYVGYVTQNFDDLVKVYVNSNADNLYYQYVVSQLQSNSTDNNTFDPNSEAGKQAIANALSQLTDEQKTSILQTAISEASNDTNKQNTINTIISNLSDDQKSLIRQTYITQIMNGEVTIELNGQQVNVKDIMDAKIKEVNEAATSITDLKGQLDSYNNFYNGLLTYTSGVSNAYNGSISLNNGISELYDGTKEFKDETADIDTKIDDEIDNMKSTLTGSDYETISFVSSDNTNIESVQFVIQTKEIKKAEVEEVKVVEDTNTSIWDKFLDLFK